MLSNIDGLRSVFLRYRHGCIVASGIAVFVSIYLFSFNRNLLYLSFLLAFYILSSALFTRFREIIVVLAVCALLGAVPVNVPDAKFIKPVPDQEIISQSYQDQFGRLQPLEAWVYVFEVYDLDKYQLECGGDLQGRLYIDGLDLDGLDIRIEGVASVGSAQILPKNASDQIQLPITVETSGRVIVILNARTGMQPKIYLGPEANGFDIYSDAVWLDFRNENCAVLYHAQRRVIIPAQSERKTR